MATSRFRMINGVWQGTGSAKPPTMPPDPPVLQSATPGDSQVALAWSGVHGATAYQALVNGAASGMQVSSASETILGLINGTLYAFSVQSIGPGGISVASNMIRVSPKAVAGAFVIGTTMPLGVGETAAGGQRVGVPSGVTLKTYDGDITNIANGQKISGLYIKGKVKPNSKVNYSIDSCQIVGGGISNSDVGLVENFTGGAVTITNSLLQIPKANVSSGWIGLYGYNITARYCEILDVVDCADIQGAAKVNTVLEAIRMHRLTNLGPDLATGGRPNTHNDCIQWQGGTGLTVRGCNMWCDLSPFSTFTAYTPSATGQVFTVTPNAGGGGPVGNLIYDQNWVDYGQYQWAVIAGGINQTSWPSMSMTRNRFGRHVKKYAAYIQNGVDIENFPSVTGPDTLAGNVYADNGAKVTITRAA